MAVQFETLTRIKKWIKDYRKTKRVALSNKYVETINGVVTDIKAFETNAITIDLKRLKDFITYIEDENRLNPNGLLPDYERQINAIRFYLVRQNDILDRSGDTRKKIFKDNDNNYHTQIALLGLPVVNYGWQPSLQYDAAGNVANPPNAYSMKKGKDYMPDPNNVKCIYAASPVSEHTGLCPPYTADILDGD